VSHEHEWKLELLGNVPIGASCQCGETSGFEEAVIGSVGTEVVLASGVRMTVRSINVEVGVHGMVVNIELLGPPPR
jgi:hypothetical protein